METNELIAILRYCASNGCIRDGVNEPCKFGDRNDNSDCINALLTEAADRLEELKPQESPCDNCQEWVCDGCKYAEHGEVKD